MSDQPYKPTSSEGETPKPSFHIGDDGVIHFDKPTEKPKSPTKRPRQAKRPKRTSTAQAPETQANDESSPWTFGSCLTGIMVLVAIVLAIVSLFN